MKQISSAVFCSLIIFAQSGACAPVDPNQSQHDAGSIEDAARPDAWVDADLAPDLIAARPYNMYVPSTYDDSPLPLILTLHGFGSYGLEQATLSGLKDYAEERNYILAYPDGTVVYNMRTWNASCCGYQTPVAQIDDVIYLRAVVADIAQKYNIDRRRIYVEGLSNGAFMAERLACDASDIFAAVSGHAGTMWAGEDEHCNPGRAVPILHSHGTVDSTVLFDGGTFYAGAYHFDYIGAESLVDFWRVNNGCDDASLSSQGDFEQDLPGSETDILSYAQGCEDNADVVFWKMNDVEHVPNITNEYRKQLVDFFYAHPMPDGT